ncbi:MAG: hypothetical protein ACRCY3_01780 [Sphingorhabdus sp.]
MKTAVFSVAAFIAVGGSMYAFMLEDRAASSDKRTNADSVQIAADPDISALQQAPIKQSEGTTDNQKATAEPTQASEPTPKKLTREQLAPPPLSEAEKLQRAAEQESNF